MKSPFGFAGQCLNLVREYNMSLLSCIAFQAIRVGHLNTDIPRVEGRMRGSLESKFGKGLLVVFTRRTKYEREIPWSKK